MFIQTVSQVVKLFLFMILGYILAKKGILPRESPKVLSKLLVWACCPALYFRTFASQFTPDKLSYSARTILVSVISLLISYLIALLLGKLLIKDPYNRNVLTYSVCVPNYGYMGNVLVLALLGESVLIEFQIFVLPVTVFMITIGYSLLLGRKTNLKSLLNPMLIAACAGIVLGLLRIPLPVFLLDALSGLSGCMGPVSMILAGCVIATFDLIKILLMKDVYLIVAIRMLLMPALAFVLGKVLNIPQGYFFLLVVFHCLPAGLNTVVYPSTIGKDSSLGAGLAVVSNIAAIITVPLFFNFVF